MKYLRLVFASLLLTALLLTSCEKNEDELVQDTLPENFKVDVPSSLTSKTQQKSAKVSELSGDEIYEHLRFFIGVGDEAAELVQAIIQSIRQHNLGQAMSFSYVSDDDGRTKNVVITENSEFDGQTWQFELTVTDAESETDEDGGYAMQVFWNNNPVQGIAILKPRNINHNDADGWSQGMFRIDYSEAGEYGYEQSMIVYISGLPTPETDIFAISSMKMFVGKNGDIVDVFGNTAHPNAVLFESEAGFDWAFAASGNDKSGLGTAEIGLPPYLLDENSREVLLGDYSILNVYTNLIQTWFFEEYGSYIDDITLAAYLENAEAPGFFNQNGFVGSGTAPSDDFNELTESIQNLTPYNPLSVANLKVSFKKAEATAK
jgi:hypothetical protein